MNKILITIFLSFFVLSVYGSPGNKDSVRYEILMSSKLLNDMKVSGNFTSSFDITSQQLILLSSDAQFYLLGLGEIVSFGNKTKPYIESFAFTPDSLLMIIRNNELCYMDSAGNLTAMFKLPNPRMGITAGKHVMYLYDRNVAKNKNALYILAREGKYVKLFEVPKPIYSAVEFNNSLLFATENAVFQFNLTSKELKVLATLPDNKTIKSLTVDPSNGRVYFSTDNMICTINNNSVLVIADKLGGTLRYLNGLIVFDAGSKLMMRMVGLESTIAAQPQPVLTNVKADQSVDVLTNSTIIDLVKSGLSDELIINIINRSKVDFDLSVDAMIDLSDQNVSSKVIMAMKQSMKKYTSN